MGQWESDSAPLNPGRLEADMKATWKLNLIAIGSLITVNTLSMDATDNRVTNATVEATLRINNQAGLTPRSLQVVKSELIRLAGEAGIAINWLDCTINVEVNPPAQCSAAVGAGEYVMNIRNFKDQEKGKNARQMALGHSWVTAQGGVYASIFADVIRVLPVSKELQDKILGHAAAHEFGHLLLGYGAHSKQGVMRAHWDKQDWAAMNVAMLRFSREEGRRMQENIRAAQILETAKK
jgi:hypothetical protein